MVVVTGAVFRLFFCFFFPLHHMSNLPITESGGASWHTPPCSAATCSTQQERTASNTSCGCILTNVSSHISPLLQLWFTLWLSREVINWSSTYIFTWAEQIIISVSLHSISKCDCWRSKNKCKQLYMSTDRTGSIHRHPSHSCHTGVLPFFSCSLQ